MNKKIVIENKNIILLFHNSNINVGGIETIWKNIYSLFSYKEFIEISKSSYTSEKNKYSNVIYLNSEKINNFLLVNCNIFINCPPNRKMYLLIKKSINCELFSLEHGNLTYDVWRKKEKNEKINLFWKFIWIFSKNLYIKKSVAKKTTHIVPTESQKKVYKNFKNFIVAKDFWIPSHINSLKVEWSKRNGIIFLGRNTFNDRSDQKNIKKMIQLNNLSHEKIKFYCSPFLNDQNFVKNIESIEEKNHVLSHAKYVIIYSKYEGFPLVAMESFLNGTPILMLDTFITAKDIIGENENSRGILIKNDDLNNVANIIENIINDEKIWNNFNKNISRYFEENKFNIGSILK